MSQMPSRKKQKTVDTLAMAAEGATESLASDDGGQIARQDAGFTEELPSLPFVHKYKNGKYYYVRECYEEYYQVVKKMLDTEEDFVTVTGTPGELHGCYSIRPRGGGIGKSVFYAYFFQYFLKEVKNTWIIATAYRECQLNEATVFEDDGKSEELVFPSTKDIVRASKRAHTQGKNVLFLCDGLPDRFLSPMVVFTSPNVEWLKSVRKDNSALYMPLWCMKMQLLGRLS
ncbi:hypothetical protein PHYPSEUDO_002214 [Phytophthora pseudosyringae]|uniref:Uncharacterized protein n=1 Tax=Phytophthora pseudosyringae TaxID=221518 RepID=A0A8T1VX50_9STRA|nr:hypothetical protein PHYPSEUDO_002214 [Phytophthora pseudosyringae]